MRAFFVVALVVLGVVDLARADWPGDPGLNLGVAVRSGGQVVPKIVATPDGGAYVGWFDNATGNFDVRLQRLDPAGNPVWGPDGLLVSNHPSMSFIVDWDMIADSGGNAVLVFSDIRAGGDLDVYAYRIAPDGTFVWGPDGVTISANADFEPDPRVAQASDGDFVVVWPTLPDATDGHLMMQRLAPDGSLRLAPGGIAVAGEVGESPGFNRVVASDAGSVIVSWVRDISTFFSPRHVRAQKFAPDGSPMWGAGPVIVFDAVSVPIAHRPQLLADAGGGAVLAWHRSVGSRFDCLVQRITAAGTELFAHNGLLVSTDTTRQRFDPSIVLDGASDDVLVFWDERNLAQSAWGVYGQRISTEGARLWSETGRELIPVSAQPRSFVRSGGFGGGAMVFWFEPPTLGSINSRVRGLRVDAGGLFVWGPIDVSSVPSPKDDLGLAQTPTGMAMLAWEDERSDSGDIYAQNVNPDGTLGVATCPADIDGDGDADVADFFAFVVAFAAGDPVADFNGDGSIDVGDFFAFVAAFAAGCP